MEFITSKPKNFHPKVNVRKNHIEASIYFYKQICSEEIFECRYIFDKITYELLNCKIKGIAVGDMFMIP